MTTEQLVDLFFDLPELLFGLGEALFKFLFDPIVSGQPATRPIVLLAGTGIVFWIILSIIKE